MLRPKCLVQSLKGYYCSTQTLLKCCFPYLYLYTITSIALNLRDVPLYCSFAWLYTERSTGQVLRPSKAIIYMYFFHQKWGGSQWNQTCLVVMCLIMALKLCLLSGTIDLMNFENEVSWLPKAGK